jgi:hypothetical protein
MSHRIAFTVRSRLPSIAPKVSVKFPASTTFIRPYIKPTTPKMSPSAEEKDKAQASTSNKEDIEGSHNEWKFRVPYKVHENDKNFKALYEGSCHCGRVQYQLSRKKPLDAKFCHCSTCQTLHGTSITLMPQRSCNVGSKVKDRLTDLIGAPFQWASIFHKEDINFTHGHHDLGWYDPGEKTTRHKLPCKVSCAYCRSPIMDEGRNMILLFPSLIKFKNKEDKKNFDPT